ncbi:MAG: hypothetical protein Q6363_008215 [Candidatus Njordarchaeota archaeon]
MYGPDFDHDWLDIVFDLSKKEDRHAARYIVYEYERRGAVYWDLQRLGLILFLYRKALRLAQNILRSYIYTNPTYDREFKRTIKDIEQIIGTINLFSPESNIEQIRTAIIQAKERTIRYLEEIVEKLRFWLELTEGGIDYTKGTRRWLNRLFLSEMYFCHFSVNFKFGMGDGTAFLHDFLSPSRFIDSIREEIKIFKEREYMRIDSYFLEFPFRDDPKTKKKRPKAILKVRLR